MEGNAPTILASNHPNSFLDAVLVAAYYPKQIYFLARGDAFKKPWAAFLLRMMHLMPIHRLEEGREHLTQNKDSFEGCMRIFRNGGTIILFPEGISRNEVELRPLRKGAARLALQAWQDETIEPLNVVPVKLSYNSFTKTPKDFRFDTGKALKKQDFNLDQEAKFYLQFNEVLKERLEGDAISESEKAGKNFLKMILFAIPAFLGFVTQRWFYVSIRNFVYKKTKNSVFYDSVLFACLMLFYPIFVLLIALIVGLLAKCFLVGLSVFLLLPITAWCYKTHKLASE